MPTGPDASLYYAQRRRLTIGKREATREAQQCRSLIQTFIGSFVTLFGVRVNLT